MRVAQRFGPKSAASAVRLRPVLGAYSNTLPVRRHVNSTQLLLALLDGANHMDIDAVDTVSQL